MYMENMLRRNLVISLVAQNLCAYDLGCGRAGVPKLAYG